jgi:hypothetical protein
MQQAITSEQRASLRSLGAAIGTKLATKAIKNIKSGKTFSPLLCPVKIEACSVAAAECFGTRVPLTFERAQSIYRKHLAEPGAKQIENQEGFGLTVRAGRLNAYAGATVRAYSTAVKKLQHAATVAESVEV